MALKTNARPGPEASSRSALTRANYKHKFCLVTGTASRIARCRRAVSIGGDILKNMEAEAETRHWPISGVGSFYVKLHSSLMAAVGSMRALAEYQRIECDMDEAVIREHLEMARRHVAHGEEIVEHQRKLVAELERDGHDSGQPRQLLEDFEGVLRLHIENRDRLEKELARGLEEDGHATTLKRGKFFNAFAKSFGLMATFGPPEAK